VTEWFELPVTKAYFERLKKEGSLRRMLLATGQVRANTAQETGEAYKVALAMAEVYEHCAAPTVEDILDEDTYED